jgi:ADP-heptose:LPS heptosyltransferase
LTPAGRLTAADFSAGTPLHHFFVWNERRWRRDRRYLVACDPDRAPAEIASAVRAAVGNPDPAAHAAVFAAFEAAHARQRRILVIRLSAFGDFVQALGPFAAIRRHHAADRISLMTTEPYAAFAQELGWFDEVLIDDRPGPLALGGWLALRRCLRRGRFDRVYDLQTSHRSGAYAALLRPGMPQWSGIAWGASHPHANRDRDRQHTLDKQAEQLLMAGIYPTPLPALPPFDHPLPLPLAARSFVLLAPGASPRHPAKRWPAALFGAVARALDAAGQLPVIVGSAAEAPLGDAIRRACPAAVDLTGQTDLGLLAALAQRARLTIGNDTGICHLAAAAGCPVIVLFSRASDPARHTPRGKQVRMLASPHLHELAAGTVIAAALEILATDCPSPSRCAGPSLSPQAGRGPG